MVTYDEGDYEGGQEDGRPQGQGNMKYCESDPLGRLVVVKILLLCGSNATLMWFKCHFNVVRQCGCSQIKLRG